MSFLYPVQRVELVRFASFANQISPILFISILLRSNHIQVFIALPKLIRYLYPFDLLLQEVHMYVGAGRIGTLYYIVCKSIKSSECQRSFLYFRVFIFFLLFSHYHEWNYKKKCTGSAMLVDEGRGGTERGIQMEWHGMGLENILTYVHTYR